MPFFHPSVMGGSSKAASSSCCSTCDRVIVTGKIRMHYMRERDGTVRLGAVALLRDGVAPAVPQ